MNKNFFFRSKIYLLSAFFIVPSLSLLAQQNYSASDLAGFNRKEAYQEAIKKNIPESDRNGYVHYKEMEYVGKKHGTWMQRIPNGNSTLAACNNVDFETGTTSGWAGFTGQNLSGKLSPMSSSVPGMVSGYQTIVTGTGTDAYGLFPIVYAGNYSLQLGNTMANYQEESISQTFTVTNANKNFTYAYAVVLQDGGHPYIEQPFFRVSMIDTTTHDSIACGTYNVSASSTNVTGWHTSTLDNTVHYKAWSLVNADLSAYIGHDVTITFNAAGCDQGGHFGYAYIDCSCTNPLVIGQNDSLCIGASAVLNAPGGAASYLWAPGGQTTQNINVTTPGTYTVTLTSFQGCTTVLTRTIGQYPQPKAGFTSTLPICLEADFTDTSKVGAPYHIASWAWSFGDGNTSASQNPTHTYSASGAYTVKLVVTSSSGCKDSATEVINPTSPVTAAFKNDTVCAGDSTSFTDLSTPGSGTLNGWNWNFGDTGSGINNTSSKQNPKHLFVTAGTYTVSLSASSTNGCSNMITHTIVVVSPSAMVVNPSNPSMCIGSSGVILTVSNAVTYTWSPSSSLSSSTGTTVTATPSVTTTYTITGVAGACTGTTTVQVIVNPLPTITITGNDSICKGTSTALTGHGGSSYAWAPAIGLSSSVGNIVIASPLTDTTYTVTGTDGNGCINTSLVRVIIRPTPLAPASPSPIVYCQGSSINPLNATGSGGILTWYKDSSSVPLGTGNSFTPSPLPTVTTSYWVAETKGGCTGPSTKVTIIIHPKPIIDSLNAIVSGPLCKGMKGSIDSIKVSGGTAPYSYSWTPTGQNTANISGLSAGSYTLTVTDASGCTAKTGPYVLVNSTVTAAFTANPMSGIQPLQVNFTNGSSNASSYEWTFGNGNSSTTTNPSTTYPNTGNYQVMLIAINSNGCRDTAYTTIDVFQKSMLVIPNVFSPNGDGKNDIFKVQSNGLSSFSAEIFNRWGVKVYTWTDPLKGWDGRNTGGTEMSAGTYYYLINATGVDGVKYAEKGFITLIR